MSRQVDLLVIGSGPAGMSAAIQARQYGLDVLVVDEQPAPGGQIWREIETVAETPRADILGSAYIEGLAVAQRFRSSGAIYKPNTRAWHFESGARAFLSRDGRAFWVDATALLLATGAQERPVPFPGWTLPGVMTIGAAQILLKSSNQIPAEPVWIAGCGPLALLYAVQLLKAGGRVAGFLDTTPSNAKFLLAGSLAKAVLTASSDLLKGLNWLASVRRNVPYVGNVVDIEAIGNDALQQIRYTTKSGNSRTVDARLLLVHEGIIPSIHSTLALGCDHSWDSRQDSYAPRLDIWGETTLPGVFVAGDGAGIGGAIAACRRGELAALRIAELAGRLKQSEAETTARPIRLQLKRALASRPFLDQFYKPRPALAQPADPTLVCRCEEVSAEQIRKQSAQGRLDPNRIKTFTRAGMGPCQGRQCNNTVVRLLAQISGQAVLDIGQYRVRPPLKPLTVSELASLGAQEEPS